jgi:hypothetical protein
MTRKLVILALVSVCFACVPTHNVKPLPDFVDKAIQPGDKVIITTKAGETIEFVVSEVTNEMLIGQDHRVALADVETLGKTSWKRPPSPCGGEKRLGCSVPLPVSLTSDVYAHYRRHFYDACAQHDYCYRHGFRTYGLDRDACDAEFLENMLKSCPAPSRFGIGEFLDTMSVDSRNTCLSTAQEFHVVVQRFGESDFQSDTSTVCEYNGPP